MPKERPEIVLKREMERIKQEFKDVVDEQVDLSKDYLPQIPEFLRNNKYHMTDDDFEDYKSYHIKMKKNLELQVIKQGKKQEVVN